MDYVFQFEFVWKYMDIILAGIKITCELTFFTMLFSAIGGIIICLMRLSHLKSLRYPAVGYIETFRAIPTLVGLVWVYYSLPIFLSFSFSPNASAIAGLTICRACYVAEIFRTGIESIEKGQIESARAIGMSYFAAMRRIILPQAMRRMIPPFINQSVTIIQLTSLASVLSVKEILHEANDVIQLTFRPLEVYTTVALIYIILIYPVTLLARYLERRLKRQFVH